MASSSKSLKIAIGSFAVTAAVAFQAVKPQETFKGLNDLSKPRMLLSRRGSCDDTENIMSIAQSLLNLHGINSKHAKGEEMLTPNNEFYQQAHKDLGGAMELANGEASKENQSIVFRAQIGRPFETVWPDVKENMKKMGTLSVIVYKENALDVLICQAQHEATDTESKVSLNANALKVKIDDQNDLVEKASRQLHMTGFPFKALKSEELLQFDTDAAVTEWSKFLRAWGVHPDEAIIEKRLKKEEFQERTASRKDMVKNYGEVKEALSQLGPKYEKYLD